jgi:acetyl-CoA C-acetyltransferase
MGFVKKGEAGKRISEGTFTLGSAKQCVINSSGGLKACGHPVGATGVKQIVEIADQLRGRCGKRQVIHANTGLTHNVGGTGATAVVHILRKEIYA